MFALLYLFVLAGGGGGEWGAGRNSGRVASLLWDRSLWRHTVKTALQSWGVESEKKQPKTQPNMHTHRLILVIFFGAIRCCCCSMSTWPFPNWKKYAYHFDPRAVLPSRKTEPAHECRYRRGRALCARQCEMHLTNNELITFKKPTLSRDRRSSGARQQRRAH